MLLNIGITQATLSLNCFLALRLIFAYKTAVSSADLAPKKTINHTDLEITPIYKLGYQSASCEIH